MNSKRLLRDKQWEEAKAPLKKLLAAYPAHTGADNAYELLAAAHRGLGETNLEREVLTQFSARTADGVDTYLRLMELDRAAQDWTNVVSNAERYLAVNPLVAPPHRHLARALEELGRTQPAIEAYRTVLLLDPPDPADAHFRLAKLLHQTGDATARRHVLQALEEAPRFRDAQRLLVEMVDGRKP